MFGSLSQPQGGTFLDLLGDEISEDNFAKYRELSILVAYAKTSGVRRLEPYITRFSAAGGIVKAIVGMGQKNISHQALRSLLNLNVEVNVFHNENKSRTFHPKVYLLSDSRGPAWASIGSSNLTAGVRA